MRGGGVERQETLQSWIYLRPEVYIFGLELFQYNQCNKLTDSDVIKISINLYIWGIPAFAHILYLQCCDLVSKSLWICTGSHVVAWGIKGNDRFKKLVSLGHGDTWANALSWRKCPCSPRFWVFLLWTVVDKLQGIYLLLISLIKLNAVSNKSSVPTCLATWSGASYLGWH